MFGFLVPYPNKVASLLGKKGYPFHRLPPANEFFPLCKQLQKKGISPERAAQLWYECLAEGNIEAAKVLKKNTGTYGQIFFGDLEE